MTNQEYAEFFREMARKVQAKPSLDRVEGSYVPPEERLLERRKWLRDKIHGCDEQIAALEAKVLSGHEIVKRCSNFPWQILDLIISKGYCPFDAKNFSPVLPLMAAGRLDDIRAEIAALENEPEPKINEIRALKNRLANRCIEQWKLFSSHWQKHENCLRECPSLNDELNKAAIDSLLDAVYLVDLADLPHGQNNNLLPIHYSELIEKRGFTHHEIIRFIQRGKLTPCNENREIILPKKFIDIQHEAAGAMYPYGQTFDEARIGIKREWERMRQYHFKIAAICPIGTADQKAEFELRQKETLEDNLARNDAEKNRRLGDIDKWEKLQTEYSEHPWSLPFDYETESPHVKTFFFNETEDEIVALTGLILTDFEKQKALAIVEPAAESEAEVKELNLLPKHITEHDLDIMKEAAPELEKLWIEISPEKGGPPQDLKEHAKRFFKDCENAYDTKWKRLRIEFLEDDALYEFPRWGQEKPDFIGRLHQKILLTDNPIQRRKPGVQTLNGIHLSIMKGQPVKK